MADHHIEQDTFLASIDSALAAAAKGQSEKAEPMSKLESVYTVCNRLSLLARGKFPLLDKALRSNLSEGSLVSLGSFKGSKEYELMLQLIDTAMNPSKDLVVLRSFTATGHLDTNYQRIQTDNILPTIATRIKKNLGVLKLPPYLYAFSQIDRCDKLPERGFFLGQKTLEERLMEPDFQGVTPAALESNLLSQLGINKTQS